MMQIGWPTRTKLIQKMAFPIALAWPRIFSNGAVMATKGIWNIIPANATPMMLCVGTPTSSSCMTAEKVKTAMAAWAGFHPRARSGV